MKRSIIFLLFALVCLSDATVSAQCAMCKASVEKSDEEKVIFKKTASGLNNGILYLMSIPYILAAIIGTLWYRNSKQEQKRKQELRQLRLADDKLS